MTPEKPQGIENDEEEENPAIVRKPGSKAQGRKRTKTGCLTCRKRRIKCGEEKPTCQNCSKSKRHCEGYNQRVVFKDPLSATRGPFAQTNSSSSGSGRSNQRRVEAPKPSTLAQWQLPSLAPKSNDSGTWNKPLPRSASETSSGFEQGIHIFSGRAAQNSAVERRSSREAAEVTPSRRDTVDRSYLTTPECRSLSTSEPTHYDFDALFEQRSPRGELQSSVTQPSPPQWIVNQNSASPTYHQGHVHNSNTQLPLLPPPMVSTHSDPDWQQPAFSHPLSLSSGTSHTPITTQVAYKWESAYAPQFELPQTAIQASGGNFPHHTASSIADQITVNNKNNYLEAGQENEQLSDDDEISLCVYAADNLGQDTFSGHDIDHGIGAVIALQARQNAQDQSLRSFTSLIDRANMLSAYNPSLKSSPLNDSMTARIFCHFINVTGPSISMFERNPANPSLIFQGRSVPSPQQHIWTYTFPMLALKNEALLHAILALASLHIAKLQKTHITASLKHYAIALRRIAKSVSIPGLREQPAILAATMLLSFYECWCADHQKWSNHLLGVRTLVRDIDFTGMTHHLKTMRAQLRNEERARYREEQIQMGATFIEDKRKFSASLEDVDENIVGVLMGRRLRYDEYGQIIDDVRENTENRVYSPKDIETYDMQRDLVWWYYKHDVYQSILGGGKLFTEYDRWGFCHPRAPLGRRDAVYGTFDHLILLMGRLADFASKDLKRKTLAMKAANNPMSNKMPDFAGMVPDVKEAKLPMGFSPTYDSSPQSPEGDDMDLEAQRLEAEEEWQDIRNAFSVIEDHFGEDFQPLGEEFSTPAQTPFGPALQYRTYGIAGIWMNYYMGLISCHRSHPSMPPAAMVAAGMAAHKTAFFVNEIGRIAAGIAPDLSMTTQVNPGVGAALVESSTCLFISGVQYQDVDQRAWLIRRLKDIDRLTGWGTALSIATGCETSWIKAAEMGRGPPYARTKDEQVTPQAWNPAQSVDRVALKEQRAATDGNFVIGTHERIQYALGVLGVQDDFENLDLDS
ncbi:hypothetical protein DSL72_005629 [Monilinia vaccinii-corymbosi]|uniref:Zn(2)-C6 fungal-type domain-containing protein n=1 Tax=Monilinia vaccinii-corymbosi TaxID=61207 RepID=A0A8A3PG63_9HELO|nr:hypothetical protein DSL72_005629 [Monilinia vaccinii-corymbosi]